jgi:hypothetical protein
MDSIGLLERAHAVGLRVWVEGEQLRVRGHKAHTAVVQEILTHKAEVLALLTNPPPGEAAAAACTHTATYRRPSGVLVCLDCGQAQVPGNPAWHRQHPLYCPEGQHVPFDDTPADYPHQCRRCPYIWNTPAAERPRDSAVHDPHCEGKGLVVMPGFGWSCPQCNKRYVIPVAPIWDAPPQAQKNR